MSITAQPTVARELQATLVDLIDLSLQGKQAHWNVIGKDFRSLHLHLDEMLAEYRLWSDEVAERLVTIGISPDGRASTVAGSTGVPAFPEGLVKDSEVVRLFVERLEKVALLMRERIKTVGEEDPITQDLFIQIGGGLEKQKWMVQAQMR